jgi:hypothetical protein
MSCILAHMSDYVHLGCSMERRIAALRTAGTEVKYLKYKNLGYGFRLGTSTSTAAGVPCFLAIVATASPTDGVRPRIRSRSPGCIRGAFNSDRQTVCSISGQYSAATAAKAWLNMYRNEERERAVETRLSIGAPAWG